MALHFHQLTIREIRKETPDCVSIKFEIPKESEHDFVFKQGQSVAIKFVADGNELRRSYSICSSPLENELRIAVKKVHNGLFSTFANERLKEGDVLEVLPPVGTFFTKVNPSHRKDYVFFAAGSGITPTISIIKTILFTEPHSALTLVYGNKTMQSVIFRDEIETLRRKYPKRFKLHHILSREDTGSDFNNGRIDVLKCYQLSKRINFNIIDDFFICGPEQMIFTIKDFLTGWGVDPNIIHFELFTTPVRESVSAQADAAQFENDESEVTVIIDDQSFEFKLGYNSKTILDAGLAEGADLPFACKGGVCCTCKAKLIEGEVEMDANYGLEKSEVKEGFILTCQSHPRSKKVVVDYDQA